MLVLFAWFAVCLLLDCLVLLIQINSVGIARFFDGVVSFTCLVFIWLGYVVVILLLLLLNICVVCFDVVGYFECWWFIFC